MGRGGFRPGAGRKPGPKKEPVKTAAIPFISKAEELAISDPLSPSLDHIIPISKGGSHERKNTQLAHLGGKINA